MCLILWWSGWIFFQFHLKSFGRTVQYFKWYIKHFYEDPCINWPESYFENNDQPNETLVNEVYEYGQRNLALIHLMIQSPYITKIKRDVAMTFTTYVANTGGLLGLCIGFSFISTIEILYWLCCCCRSLNYKRLYCNKEKWNSIVIKLTWKACNFCVNELLTEAEKQNC